MTPEALAALKTRLDRDLATASANHPLRLGGALYDSFAAQGLFVDRVFHTSHRPVVTAIFPTYEDRAVHRDASLGPHDYAIGKKVAPVA